MREIRSYGSVGERGGNKPLYPENPLRNMHQPSDCLKTFLQKEFIQTIGCDIRQILKCQAV